jgi:hypothetical protein
MAGKSKQQGAKADNPNWGGKREGAGRPKKEYIQNVKELLAEHIDQETVMSKLGELIDNGDYRAIDLWMKYAYGTPKQTMDINTTGDVDINFKLSNLIRFKEEE